MYVVIWEEKKSKTFFVLGPFRTAKAAQKLADKKYDLITTTRHDVFTVHEVNKP